MKKILWVLVVFGAFGFLTGCGPKGDTPTDKRQLVLQTTEIWTMVNTGVVINTYILQRS